MIFREQGDRVGIPVSRVDYKPADDYDGQCKEQAPDNSYSYSCTRPEGHEGLHAAHNSEEVVAVWGETHFGRTSEGDDS